MTTITIAPKLKKLFLKKAESTFPDCRVIWLEDLDEKERLEAVSHTDLLLAAKITDELTAEEKQLLDRPKMVQTILTGADHHDFRKLPKGIPLYCNAGGWAHGIAESTLGMIICNNRCLREQTEELSRGVFNATGHNQKLLCEQTFLILGFGGIGQAVAKVLKPFGGKVYAIGRTAPASDLLNGGFAMKDLKEILPQADVLILSLPKTKETEGIINKETLSLMKEDAQIIDVARAALIDYEDILSHIKTHPLFHLSMDVWWKEFDSYPSKGYEILKYPNVTGSAHNAEKTSFALEEAVSNAFGNMRNFLDGKPVKGKVKISEYM